MQKTRNETMSFNYDGLPPLSRSSVNHEGLTPEQEWAKIADAAERRKIQNRNAQRKYRHNLKRRVEALERQHNLGAFSTSKTPSLDNSTSTTPRAESLPPVMESPPQMQDMSLPIKEGSISPQSHTIDLMDPALSSIPSLCSSTSMDHDWMSQSHFMGPPSSSRTTPLHSPAISQSPEYLTTKFQSDDEKDQLRISSSMMSMSSLDDYISHNNSIIEDMCGSAESISGDDIELSFQHMHQQRQQPQRITNPEPALGRTTLHLAAMKGYIQIVHMLLEKGIDINTKDSQGWTALHLAAERGQQAVVKLLLDRGADFYARI